MARSKSASRSAAATKASKTRKRRATAKKAATTRKRRAAGKKAAALRKELKLPDKVSAARSQPPQALAEVDARIAIVRDNLRELTEQAAAVSGGSTEELLSERIAEQEAKLDLLRKQREKLVGQKG